MGGEKKRKRQRLMRRYGGRRKASKSQPAAPAEQTKSATVLPIITTTSAEQVQSQILIVPRHLIRPFPNQPRSYFDQKELRDLAASIKEIGQQVAVIVIPVENDPLVRYELVDGQRRWLACEIARVTTMKVDVRGDIANSDDQYVTSFVVNFNRAGHTPMEIAFGIEKLKKQGKTHEQIATLAGKSTVWVWQYGTLNGLAKEVQTLLEPTTPEDQRISLQVALLLTKLPPAIQVEKAREITAGGMSFVRARQLVENAIDVHGTREGFRQRKPSDLFGPIKTFVSRIREQAEIQAGLDSGYLRRVLGSRTHQERLILVSGIDATIRNLTTLREKIVALDGGQAKTSTKPTMTSAITRLAVAKQASI